MRELDKTPVNVEGIRRKVLIDCIVLILNLIIVVVFHARLEIVVRNSPLVCALLGLLFFWYWIVGTIRDVQQYRKAV